MAAAAATASSPAIFCDLSPQKSAKTPKDLPNSVYPPRLLRSGDAGKTVHQPRLCTLRSYGPDYGDGVIRRPLKGDEADVDGGASGFFASLADYIDSSRKSQDFEIISGRLAMIAFAGAVGVEFVTGNSLFKKLELQQITEAAGLCVAVVSLAATFAWSSSAKSQIGQIFTLGCNQFVDSLIDNLIDGLFYDTDNTDWSDEN